jgi:hypothetical protein
MLYPTIWVEFFRIGKKGFLMRQGPAVGDYHRVLGNAGAFVGDVFGHGVRHTALNDGTPAESFLHDGCDVGESGLVFESREEIGADD